MENKNTDTYEFYLFRGNQRMVDRDLKKLQNQGWELAGEVKPFEGNNGYTGMLIPLKRKINNLTHLI